MYTRENSMSIKKMHSGRLEVYLGQMKTSYWGTTLSGLWEVLKEAAAAAKLFSSYCPALCDPVDLQLSGYSVHGIIQGKVLGGFMMPYHQRSGGEGKYICDFGWQEYMDGTQYTKDFMLVTKGWCQYGGIYLTLNLKACRIGSWN